MGKYTLEDILGLTGLRICGVGNLAYDIYTCHLVARCVDTVGTMCIATAACTMHHLDKCLHVAVQNLSTNVGKFIDHNCQHQSTTNMSC